MWKRGFRSKGPSTSMKVRANAVILTFVLLCALGLCVNLFRIMILQHNEYRNGKFPPVRYGDHSGGARFDL